MRRAQFEVLGLAVIMIILSVAVFFTLSITNNSTGPDTHTRFQDEQFSQNVLDAMLKTSIEECPRYTVFDAISWQLGAGSAPKTISGNGNCKDNSQSDLTDRFQWINDEIVNRVFEEYSGKDYHLQIRKPVCPEISGEGCEKAVYYSNNCQPLNVGRPGRQIISLYPQGSAEIVLWTCSAST